MFKKGIPYSQKSITLKAIRNDQIKGFECGFIAKPEDMIGKLEPFVQCWNINIWVMAHKNFLLKLKMHRSGYGILVNKEKCDE